MSEAKLAALGIIVVTMGILAWRATENPGNVQLVIGALIALGGVLANGVQDALRLALWDRGGRPASAMRQETLVDYGRVDEQAARTAFLQARTAQLSPRQRLNASERQIVDAVASAEFDARAMQS